MGKVSKTGQVAEEKIQQEQNWDKGDLVALQDDVCSRIGVEEGGDLSQSPFRAGRNDPCKASASCRSFRSPALTDGFQDRFRTIMSGDQSSVDLVHRPISTNANDRRVLVDVHLRHDLGRMANREQDQNVKVNGTRSECLK